MSSPSSRSLGLLYGQFIGDAFGSRYEFKSSPIVKKKLEADRTSSGYIPLIGEGPFGYGPGVVTDDGEMAMSLLSSCIQLGSFDSSHVACAYARWRLTSPPDIGNTCSAALSLDVNDPLSRKLTSSDWSSKLSQEEKSAVRMMIEENVKRRNSQSLSNGSLMRQSVLAAFYSNEKTYAHLLSSVKSDTLLTHSHPDANEASLAYARTLYYLINGSTPEEAYQKTLEQTKSELIRSILKAAAERMIPVELSDGKKSNGDDIAIGYLGVAMQVSYHLLLHSSSFEDGLVSAVSIGGDTDTNGCIAAALLGARFGIESIPDYWKKSVEKGELRLKGENGIESFEQLIEGVRRRYEK